MSKLNLLMSTKNKLILVFSMLLIAIGVLATVSLYASGGPVITPGILYGRGVVLSPEGNPYFAEYDEAGKVVSVINEEKDAYENALVISALRYKLNQATYKIVREEYGPLVDLQTEILTKTEFDAKQYTDVEILEIGSDAPIKIPVPKGELYPSTRSVMVLRQAPVGEQSNGITDPRLLDQDKGVILYEADFDLTEALTREFGEQIVNIIVDENGKFLFESQYNIGYRSAFIKKPNYQGNFTFDHLTHSYNRGEDELWSGIEATVESTLASNALSYSIDGKFTLYDWIPPCPGFSYFWDFDIYAGVDFKNFNPQAYRPIAKHYFKSQSVAHCSGFGEVLLGTNLAALSAQTAIIGIEALNAVNVRAIKIPVDVVMFTGQGVYQNPQSKFVEPDPEVTLPEYVLIDGKTEYNSDVFGYTRIYESTAADVEPPEENDIRTEELDLDGDRQADWISDPGSINAEGGIIGELNLNTEDDLTDIHELDPDPDAPLYVGVYFGATGVNGYSETNVPLDIDSEGNTFPKEPHMVRLADQNPDFKHRGLLKTITEEDMENTDFYVYRLSNSQLISEREGLKTLTRENGTSAEAFESAINGGVIKGENTLDPQSIEDLDRFYYRIVIPGPRAGNSFSGKRSNNNNLEDWQQNIGVSEELQGYSADSLRAGELVQVIAINRATGYMGSLKLPLKLANQFRIDIPLNQMIMQPPNLKVRVERTYDIKNGLTRTEPGDDPEKYLVGSEGAGLTTDTYLAIYTEWFDHDGSELPSDLTGYTARLAKTVGKDASAELVNANVVSGVEFFDVKPGNRVQLVKLEGDTLGTEHFYLHLHGTNNDGRVDLELPDFTPGEAEEILKKRPEKYVPVLVPISDELATRQARNNARYQHEDATEEFPYVGPLPHEIEPIYRWIYRPEMQFSVYELKVSKINRTNEQGVLNILDLSDEIVGAVNEESLEIIYDLIDNLSADPLEMFGPGQDLVFSLQGYETAVDPGSSPNLFFEDLNYLSALSVSDFFALRLYANTDPENVLWEWAFKVPMFIASEFTEVTADNPEIGITVGLPTLMSKMKSLSQPLTIKWSILGPDGASLESNVTSSENGVFSNKFFTSRVADDEFKLLLTVIESDNVEYPVGYEQKIGPYTVIAGKTEVIELTSSESVLSADEISLATLNATAHDAYGNLVEDGTPIFWEIESDGDFDIDFSVEYQETSTTDGATSVTYKVGDMTVPSNVRIYSGNADEYVPIDKTAIDVLLTSTENSLTVGINETLELTVETDAPNGTPVQWDTTHGKILNENLSVLNGTARATLLVSDVAGEGFVTVNVADSTDEIVVLHNSATQNSNGLVARFEHAAIVAESNPGVYVIEDGINGPEFEAYITSTNTILEGAPNEQIYLETGSFYMPNALPIINLYMNDVVEETEIIVDPQTNAESVQFTRLVTDVVNNKRAIAFGSVQTDNNDSYENGGASLSFDGGYLTLKSENLLTETDGFFLNIRFKSTSTDGVQRLVYKGTGTDVDIELAIIENGEKLQASVGTADGVFVVQADTTLEQDKWYLAGIRVRNGELQLGLDDEYYNVPVTGGMTQHGPNIGIGSPAFSGNIDEVQIGFENEQTALMSFSDGSINQTITLDADGKATVGIKATGNPVPSGNIIGFSAKSILLNGETKKKNIHFAHYVDKVVRKILDYNSIYAAEPNPSLVRGGLALVSPANFGRVANFLGKKFFGAQTFGKIKKAAAFVYSLTGLHDIQILGKALFAMIRGKPLPDGISTFDLVFAGIGLAITVAAIFTGGAALSLKAGLGGLKPVLRELFDTGLPALLNLGVMVAKYTFRLIRNPGKSLSELAAGFGRLSGGAAALAFKYFAKVVKGIDSLKDWAKMAKSAPSVANRLEIALDSGRISADAARSIQSAVARLSDAGHVIRSEGAVELLIKMGKQDAAFAESFATQALRGFRKSNNRGLRFGAGQLDDFLSVLNKVPDDLDGYAAWIKPLTQKNPDKVKGLFGEAKMIERGLDATGDGAAVRKILNDRTTRVAPGSSRRGLEGADFVSRPPTYVGEAKTYNSLSDRAQGIANQYEKNIHQHVATSFDPIEGFIDGVPKLETVIIDISNSGFTPEEIIDLNNKFSEIFNKPDFSAFRDAGLAFSEADIIIEAGPAYLQTITLPPLP